MYPPFKRLLLCAGRSHHYCVEAVQTVRRVERERLLALLLNLFSSDKIQVQNGPKAVPLRFVMLSASLAGYAKNVQLDCLPC